MAYIIDTEHSVLKKYIPEPGETELTLPDNIQIIGENAFAECSNLYTVRIPEGVTCIQKEAFRNCKELILIQLPESLREIGKAAFQDCQSLEKIIIPECVNAIPKRTFQGCTNLRSVTLPNTLNYLGNRAFKECSCLTSIVIPEGIKEIKLGTFLGCDQLHFVKIPEGVKKIQLIAFSKTTVLQFQIKNQVFSIVYSPEYQLLASAMCQTENPASTKVIIHEFIRHSDIENLKKFLKCGFVTISEQIDEFIRYAIEQKKYEAQVVLMDYKHEHIGFEPKSWDL